MIREFDWAIQKAPEAHQYIQQSHTRKQPPDLVTNDEKKNTDDIKVFLATHKSSYMTVYSYAKFKVLCFFFSLIGKAYLHLPASI